MSVQEQHRQVGDTRTALACTLKQNNTAVDLTSLTVTFQMVDPEDESDVISETSTGVTVTDASAGQVKYTFSAAGVANEGTFYAYFRAATAGSAKDTFPVVTGEMRVVIHPRART